MADAGFFRGTTTEQDLRFPDKQKKLLRTLPFPPEYQRKVNMSKVNLDTMKAWITTKINEILDNEDEILENFVLNQLECGEPDPRYIQINLTGFLNAKNAKDFVYELWKLLLEAQETPDGIPMSLVNERMELERQIARMKAKEDKRLQDIARLPTEKPPVTEADKRRQSPKKKKRPSSPSSRNQSAHGWEHRRQSRDDGQVRRSRSRNRRHYDYRKSYNASRSRSRSPNYRRDTYGDSSHGGRYRDDSRSRGYHPKYRRSSPRQNSRQSPVREERHRFRNASPQRSGKSSRRFDDDEAPSRHEASPGRGGSNKERRWSPSSTRKPRKWSPIVWSDESRQKHGDDDNADERSRGKDGSDRHGRSRGRDYGSGRVSPSAGDEENYRRRGNNEGDFERATSFRERERSPKPRDRYGWEDQRKYCDRSPRFDEPPPHEDFHPRVRDNGNERFGGPYEYWNEYRGGISGDNYEGLEDIERGEGGGGGGGGGGEEEQGGGEGQGVGPDWFNLPPDHYDHPPFFEEPYCGRRDYYDNISLSEGQRFHANNWKRGARPPRRQRGGYRGADRQERSYRGNGARYKSPERRSNYGETRPVSKHCSDDAKEACRAQNYRRKDKSQDDKAPSNQEPSKKGDRKDFSERNDKSQDDKAPSNQEPSKKGYRKDLSETPKGKGAEEEGSSKARFGGRRERDTAQRKDDADSLGRSEEAKTSALENKSRPSASLSQRSTRGDQERANASREEGDQSEWELREIALRSLRTRTRS